MAKFTIRNLNGKIWIDSAWWHWKSSFSFRHVKTYWPVYGYWVSFLLYCMSSWFPGTVPPALYVSYSAERWIEENGRWIWIFAPGTVFNIAWFFFHLSFFMFVVCCLFCVYYWIRKNKPVAIQYSLYVSGMVIFSYCIFPVFALHFILLYWSGWTFGMSTPWILQ